MEDSIGNYQRALDAAPYDEAGAWYSLEKHNALVADSPDPAARMVDAPVEPGAGREVLTTGARRTDPDGSRHPPALLAGYSGDLYTVEVKPVDTHIARIERRPPSTGRPVPVEPATALGPVLLELYGRQGTLVLSRWYPLEAMHGDFGPEGGPTWSQSWDVHVDRPPQWSCLRMLADASLPPGRGSTVIEIAASPNPPVVELTAPRSCAPRGP